MAIIKIISDSTPSPMPVHGVQACSVHVIIAGDVNARLNVSFKSCACLVDRPCRNHE
jgi:hypothetical protein